jgi:hypothetical protein
MKKEFRYVRTWACTPFRFDAGVKIRITFRGRHFGLDGTIVRRTRMIKPVYPPSAPENYYSVLLEKDKSEEVFRENDIELHE